MAITSLFVCLGGCASTPDSPPQMRQITPVQDTRNEKLKSLSVQAAMKQSDPNAEYRIGADDVIDIEVFQVEELKKTVRVSSDGYIGLPLVGSLLVRDMTTQQVQQELTKRLDKYLQDPLVSVYLREFKAQKIAVIGAVRQPQVYSVTGQRYLLDMLTAAGGLTHDAGSVAYLLRPLSQEKGATKEETIAIDLSDLFEKGNLSLNIPVYGGDVINVPKGGVFFMDGAIARPGVFPMTSKITLMQAIAMGGGVLFEGQKSKIKIYRYTAEGNQEMIEVDAEEIEKGKKPDMRISEYDIVVVGFHPVKNFFRGIGKMFAPSIGVTGPTIGIGGGSSPQ